MKREYHCLVAGLPALFFEPSRLASTLAAWKIQLREDLQSSDYQMIESFFLRYDNRNVHAKIAGKPEAWDILGNYTKEQVEEIMSLLKDEDTDPGSLDFPIYLSRYIRAFKADTPFEADRSWENQLAGLYYNHLADLSNPFIKDWYAYELDLTNIITAMSCRKHQVEVRNQLVGENEITEKLIRSNARDFGISNEFPLLDAILRAGDEEDFMEREKKYDLVKWRYLDDNVFFHYFTIEIIFTFIVKLEIISRWLKLDKNTGEKLFRDLVGQMKSTYRFPEEFTI